MTSPKENNEHFVAIAMALYEHEQANRHDDAQLRFTFKKADIPSAWNLKPFLLREKPIKHIY